jgi:hypothetical protein
MSQPYKVIVDDDGCRECQSERTWCILDPYEVASSTSYGDEEEAEHICELLNTAYQQGYEKRDYEVRAALI